MCSCNVQVLIRLDTDVALLFICRVVK